MYNSFKSKIFFAYIFILINTLISCNLFAQSLQEILESSAAESSINNFFGTDFTQLSQDDKSLEVDTSQLSKQSEVYFEELRSSTKLELYYSTRADKPLTLQGYTFFTNVYKTGLTKSSGQGGKQDDYILGVGDEVILVLQGGKNQVLRKKVSKDGLIILGFGEPISATGRKLKEIKEEIKFLVKKSFLETNVYISLTSLKKVSVSVSGEVNIPGPMKLSGLSNLFEALVLSGGIKKTGSLRNIIVLEGDKERKIDLYPLIFGYPNNNFQNINLKNNSIIFVPPINNTVAITGNVKRPGIYELKGSKEDIKDLIKLSGNPNLPGKNELVLQRLSKDGIDSLKEVSNVNLTLNNGDILTKIFKQPRSEGMVKLKGAVNFPTILPIQSYSNLSEIINKQSIFTKDSYRYAVIIKSNDKINNTANFVIKNVLFNKNSKNNYKLKQDDDVIVLGNKDLDFITSETVLSIINNTSSRTNTNLLPRANTQMCSALSELNKFVNFDRKSKLEEISLQNLVYLGNIKNENMSSTNPVNLCPKIYRDFPQLLTFLIKNVIVIRGDLDRPGIYLAENNYNEESLARYAGFKNGNIITSSDKKLLDVISETVFLRGPFRFSNEIKISGNTTLSSILNNTSSVSKTTYPFFGYIIRRDKFSGIQNTIAFSPIDIFSKIKDQKLLPADEIVLFTKDEIFEFLKVITKNNSESLSNNIIENDIQTASTSSLVLPANIETLIEPDIINENLDIPSYIGDNISSIINENANIINKDEITENIDKPDKEVKNTFSQKISKFDQFPNKTNDFIETIEIIKSSLVKLEGAVVHSGDYPIGGPTNISDLVDYAGGFLSHAIPQKIEIFNNKPGYSNYGMLIPGGKAFVPSLEKDKIGVTIEGAVKDQRRLSIYNEQTLSNLFKNSIQFDEDAYFHFSTIERVQPSTNTKKYYAFSVSEVINERQDFKLELGDKLKFYTNSDINKLITNFQKDKITQNPDIKFGKNINSLPYSGSISDLVSSLLIKTEGEISNPGNYLLAGFYNLSDILEISGGILNTANLKNLQVISPNFNESGNIELVRFNFDQENINFSEQYINSGSVIRVPSISNDLKLGFVEINGAVFQKGTYRINRGDTIFDIIKRSGGLLDNAFINGLVFTREKEKKREEESIKLLKRELEKSIAIALETSASKSSVDLSSLSALKDITLAAASYQPIGRVVGEFSNIDTLKNTTLINGDKIFIPSKPSSITLTGEIMTPGSILWDPRKKVDDYIDSAAGFTELADKRRVFVILPNGKAVRQSGIWSSYNFISPGSTIIIPRRIQLASTLEKISAVTSIFYQLTLSLAGIESVLND